jgi:signal transduction histidine kinase/ligand-binding sensor domain-containing protein
MKKQLTIILSFVFSLSSLYSQLYNDMRITRISTKNKLPTRKITVIFEDSKGFMWIGTQGSGLYRYDGYNFKEFNYAYWDPEKKDTNLYSKEVTIWSIVEDKEGIIWSAGLNGLYKYNPRESETISNRYALHPTDWRMALVYAMQEDHKGNLWLGTYNGNNLPVFNKKNEAFRFVKLDPDEPDTIDGRSFTVRSIIMDKENNLWFGTNRGLYKYDQNKEEFKGYKVVPDNTTNSENIIICILEGDSDNIWVGTLNGLFEFDKRSEKFSCKYLEANEANIQFKNAIGSLAKDKNGNVWFRTTENLCVFQQSDKKSTLKKIYAYSPGWIEENHSLFTDKSGNIWFATYEEGINILNAESKYFRTLRTDSYARNSIRGYPFCVCEDKHGIVWIGTYGSGLTRYDKEKNEFTHFVHNPSDSNSISGNNISVIYQDHAGTLWIGTDGSGLNQLIVSRDNQIHFKRFQSIQENPACIASNKIFRIFEDQNNDLWILTELGLDEFDRKRELFFHLKLNAIPTSNDLSCDAGEFENEIWFPYWTGIYRVIPPFSKISKNDIEAGKLIFYQHGSADSSSLPIKILSNIGYLSRIYQPGTLWFGSAIGLGKMMKTMDENTNHCSVSFKFYTKEEGYTGNVIPGILEDKYGKIWLSTDEGLLKFDPVSELFTHYSFLDYFNSNVFCGWQPFRNKDGTMYFPHVDGILIFNPDSLQENSPIPTVLITDFTLFGKSVKADKNAPLKKPILYAEEIKLLHYQNNLTFEFAVMDYIDPDRNRYRYKMEGLDKEWVYADTRRTANYSSLRPGKYTFRVQGSNSDGVWNTEGAFVKVIIKPPWWNTTIAFISYVILIFLLIGGYVKLRTWRFRKEKDELEKLVKERTQQIQEANEELLQQKEEIQTTLEHLKQTQEQLIASEKMAALGGLVAGVAHEINTPVGITITAASNLKEETEKMAKLYKENKISRAEFMEYMNASNQSVNLILSNMERTATMIQSFKQVSVDQSTEQKRTFKLKSYTEDVFRSLYPKLKKRKIHIKLDIDEELEIESYPGAYSQIITNLVLNSITHGFEEKHRGRIDLKAMNENGELIMEYKDNGKGIPKENQKKIYDPFFTTNKKIGTGLGMHIVYNLVTQKLRGSIECISGPGQGVIFKMQIPVK